ncbi:YtxH domain-containing protein [Streptomyces sp. NPDC089799]|uniref:YtxH domain-containing protein n=1 Tax=Streptomyces sp. NPDC089799 TaxID=3155066 RepID=UPI00343E1D2D
MRYKVTFAVGLALGYVLGTRAGRERYEQLRKSARELAQNPVVRNAAEQAGQTSRQYAGKAVSAVGGRIGDSLPEPVARRVRSLRDRQHGIDDDWGTSNT